MIDEMGKRVSSTSGVAQWRTDDTTPRDIAQWRMDDTTPCAKRDEYLFDMREMVWHYGWIKEKGNFRQTRVLEEEEAAQSSTDCGGTDDRDEPCRVRVTGSRRTSGSQSQERGKVRKR